MLTGLLRCKAAPAILSPPFAYREASLRFYAHVGRVSRSCTPLCKHRRARTFRPYKHKKVPGRIFQTHRTKRDVRSTFIRLFGTCISLPLKRIHLKIKGEVFWLGVILLIFLLSFHQWIIDHSSPLQQQGLPQIHTAFPFPFDLFTFFLSPERPALLCSIAHEKQNARTFCHFIFHEPEGIFMSNFLSSFLIIVNTGTCFFRRAWTIG